MGAFALLVAALLGAPAGEPADTIAFTNGAKVYTARADGTQVELLLSPPRSVADVAFDRAGVLYLSALGSRPGCDVYRGGGRRPVLGFSDIRRKVRGEIGFCDITSDPRGGLLFDVTANSFPSEQVWHLDSATRRIRRVANGFQPSFAPDGRRLVLADHRADYPALVLGVPGRLSSFRVISPTPRADEDVGYSYPAFAPDGRRIAAIRTLARDRKHPVESVLVGPAGGRLRTVWQVRDGRRLGDVAWLGDGRVLLINVYDTRRASIGDVYRLPIGGGKPRRILQDVTAFDVRRRSAGSR